MDDSEKMLCGRCDGTGIDPEVDEQGCEQICKKCAGVRKLDWVSNVTGMELTREQKTILFVINTLNELADEGILTKGPFEIDPEYKAIIKSFNPTPEEIKEVIDLLRLEGYIR
jgi:hypothetical protein